jgi:hypothetical protein
MPFGGGEGRFNWFNNQTALDYSYKAVDAAIKFIQTSGFPSHFTLEPLNEPVDNRNIMFFGTPLALSDNGAAWVTKYIQGVISRVTAANPKIPVMLSDGFKGTEAFSKSFPASTNLVFDIHNYYFAGRSVSSANQTAAIQAELENTFVSRAKNLNTGLYAFNKYTAGNAYWTAKFFGNATVDGEGVQADYWNYLALAKLDINPSSGAAFCK